VVAFPIPFHHFKVRIVIDRETFNRKISLLITKINIELKKNWLGVMFGKLLYMAQRPGHYEN